MSYRNHYWYREIITILLYFWLVSNREELVPFNNFEYAFKLVLDKEPYLINKKDMVHQQYVQLLRLKLYYERSVVILLLIACFIIEHILWFFLVEYHFKNNYTILYEIFH